MSPARRLTAERQRTPDVVLPGCVEGRVESPGCCTGVLPGRVVVLPDNGLPNEELPDSGLPNEELSDRELPNEELPDRKLELSGSVVWKFEEPVRGCWRV
jgi:hypothetical protein